MFLLLINYSACIIIMAKTENKVLLIIKLMVLDLHKKNWCTTDLTLNAH